MRRGQRPPRPIPFDAIEANCLTCHRLLPRTTEFFHVKGDGSDSLRRECRTCANEKAKIRQKQPEVNKRHCDRMREKTFGLTAEEYEELVVYQDNKCAICGKSEWRLNRVGETRRLSVDHDHETGEIRGLLCHGCNAGLGLFMDSPEILFEAIRYLNEHHYAEQLLAEMRDA